MRISVFIATCAALLALVSGCSATSPARSSAIQCVYAREHKLPEKGETKTFAFDTDSTGRGTKAYENYCDQVARALTKYGWRRIDGPNKKPTETPDYWVTVVYGYSLNQSSDMGSYVRISANSLVSDTTAPVSDFYARVLAYYAGVNITTQPRGEGENMFLAQIFGSSNADMSLLIPTMLEQLLKDFPGKIVKNENVMLNTHRGL